ncbi:MAG TPA: phospho-N-acetylmuramoyl-pentapeptide-transferase [Flavobacteriaceae bacterium]|nr:phospho-N-acetylmuramoyl-pentapeptide-transferase [Flavobacteriaceae bacterium]MCB9213082.1 phospho-N-acetylmuramoyl-pentapeptide-transferase [Alteromonas sp.]HPF10987.1 phospho-N-acetylmuramoyl-pentapeptide-transferase [Flavobacteriaceae bacterium]HQU20271.1 phospho-N-acetylmuramoyl-pentapeptide-transferase [Flavobacteriaceae bacterium]HQU64163.1 phospho-N-acetylmuramoyl-pentapeptide-transferase [Flavobacteriaceae bacterium]
MLYYLFDFLEKTYNVPGAGLFQFITFRAALAVMLSLFIATVYGKKIILLLQRKQVGETIRNLGLEGQNEKAGTPTMGGIIIILATIVPVLLFAKLENIYVIMLLITTVWMGTIGFIDDYIKKFKKDKAGLPGKFKVFGQVGLGIIVGATMYFHDDITVRREKLDVPHQVAQNASNDFYAEEKTLLTTLPFVKDNEINYEKLVTWMGDDYKKYAWIIFIPIVIFIITAVSNGANLTDGIDGLAAGSSAIIGVTLAIFAWVSGNVIFSDYLNIMYIPNTGELTIFIMSFVGALIGFLWYNTYPAQVFMGDTGSLTIGGIIAVIAIAIRKEWLIPILCGIFLMENLSVVLQVSWFKYTKKKYGEGRRIFRMSPLHHHYQIKGYHESKIVTRFWIVGIVLAVLTIVTLKIR